MEEKDLLSSLESLERDLQSVNSAREQVESTVKAYHEVGAKFNDYVSNLKAVSANIATLVETIKNERSAFSSSMDETTKAKFRELDDEIDRFKNAIEPLLSQYKATAESLQTSAQQSLTKAVRDLNTTSQQIGTKFKESCDNFTKQQTSSIESKLIEIINGAKNEFSQMSSRNKTATANVVSTLESKSTSITTQFGDKCDTIQQGFTSSTDRTSSDFRKKVDDSTAKVEGSVLLLKKVLGDFKGLQQHIEVTMADYQKPVLEKLNQISSTQSDIQKQINLNKVLTIVAIVLVVVTIIIRVI